MQALEEGRFDDVPGATYVAGFLRTYANYLDLDGEEIVRMFKDDSGGVLVRQNLYFPIPASEARRPTGAMIIGALLVAIIALALWYAIKERQFVDIDLVPPVPGFLDESSSEDRAVLAAQEVDQTGAGSTDVENLFAGETVDVSIPQDDVIAPVEPFREAPVVAPAASEVSETAAPTEVAEPTSEVPVPEAPPELVAEPEGDNEVVVATDAGAVLAVAAPDEDYVPRVYGRTNANARIEIRAIDTSWVQIEAPGSQVLLTRVLLPGDVYWVPNGDQITLKTGNAGGLELRVDGELVDPLGETGAVIEDVVLDPDSLLQQ